jgi:hypothetical protein
MRSSVFAKSCTKLSRGLIKDENEFGGFSHCARGQRLRFRLSQRPAVRRKREMADLSEINVLVIHFADDFEGGVVNSREGKGSRANDGFAAVEAQAVFLVIRPAAVGHDAVAGKFEFVRGLFDPEGLADDGQAGRGVG